MKNKGFIVFLLTYLIATFIRAITGVSFNPFSNKFDAVLFIKDLTIWTLTFIVVNFTMSKITK